MCKEKISTGESNKLRGMNIRLVVNLHRENEDSITNVFGNKLVRVAPGRH